MSTLLEWNAIAKKHNLPQVLKLSKIRIAHINAREKEEAFDLEKISQEIGRSDFLRGGNKDGWKVSFDFVFGSENNYLKILEGKYRGGQADKPEVPRQFYCYECRRMIPEKYWDSHKRKCPAEERIQ